MRRRQIVRQRTEEAKAALLNPIQPQIEIQEKTHEEKVQEPQKRKVLGPKQLCHICGKVPARYFHVKWCGKKK